MSTTIEELPTGSSHSPTVELKPLNPYQEETKEIPEDWCWLRDIVSAYAHLCKHWVASESGLTQPVNNELIEIDRLLFTGFLDIIKALN